MIKGTRSFFGICIVSMIVFGMCASAELPGTGSCTPDHCHYCETDGETSWCSRCGNGKVISAEKGKNRFCDKNINIKNCKATALDDLTNPDKCGDCKEGYYLESPTKCVKLELANCDLPVKRSKDGPVLCGGCLKKFLKNDESGCADKTDETEEFPDNCVYGSTAKLGKCQRCEPGWTASVTGKSCEEERVKGCAIYHPNDTNACFTCNTDLGFYAVSAKTDGNDVHQICKLNTLIAQFSVISSILLGLFLVR